MSDQPLTARDLALKLNLKRHPRSWRGECPACSYARAFSLRSGDEGRPLMRCVNGCDANELQKAVERIAGGELQPRRVVDEQDAAKRRQDRQEAALRVWRGSAPLDRPYARPVLTYLAARGLGAIGAPADLRFRSDCSHPEVGRCPALVALVRDAAGQPIGVHRTYLASDGHGKAGVEPDKASLGPIWGGAVRLHAAPEATSFPEGLIVGEGIESSAAAAILMKLPAWAALSAGNLAKGLELPERVRHVVIAADNDLPTKQGRWPGQEAAQAAARRWRAEGRTVQIALPRKPGFDFNDVLVRGDANAE